MREVESGRAMEHHEVGRTLVREGRPATTIYCIHHGLIKLTRLNGDGEQLAWQLLGPGDVVGYRDVLADGPYGATAETVTHSRICAVPRESFEKLLRETPQLALDLLTGLARDLRQNDRRLTLGVSEPVRQRAARLLLQLWEAEPGDSDVRTLTAPLLRSEMSQIIGTTPETFSRTLRTLAESGAIEFGRRTMTVRDPQQLRLMAQGDTGR